MGLASRRFSHDSAMHNAGLQYLLVDAEMGKDNRLSASDKLAVADNVEKMFVPREIAPGQMLR